MSDVAKILHAYKVYPPDVEGGIPSVIATLCSCTSSKFSNSILVARTQGLGRNYQSHGTPIEAVSSLGTLFSTPVAPHYPHAFLRHANASDIVIHHAPFPLTDIVAPWLAKPVALVVYWHADITRYPVLKRFVGPSITRTLERADKIIVSDSSMISESNSLKSFEAKCSIVPYGSDLQFWSTCTEDEQASSRVLRKRHPRLIVAVGRLVAYKGFASLLRALVQIEGELIIIGEGPLLADLKRLSNELGVSERVTFIGRTEPSEIKAHLYAAQVLAFPSIDPAEAFGLVQLEAMATGLPIVNTSLATAVPKIARHEREALTVPPNDPDSLATALRAILSDGALANRLGQAGKARALKEYSQATYVTKIEHIYEELLARPQERSRHLTQKART